MSQPAQPSTTDRLDSWKDIAVYLKRDISTVQRWEQREKMPVHRHLHDRRGSVYAFHSELDVWLETRRPRLKQDAETRALDGVETIAPASAVRILAKLQWMRAAVATALVLAGIAYLFVSSRVATTPRMIRAVAVLPLQNLSGDSGQDFFVDGMTEALIERLSSMQGVRVISRTSVMQFKHSSQSLPEIAKILGVDAVVEGSVVRSGRRVHISAQLIRGESDDHLWSGSYDREAGDVLALQSEVALAIARQIQISVAGRESGSRSAPNTPAVSLDVYEDYLKGRFALNRTPTPDLEASVRYFEAAIAKDASFAPAYSGLGAAHAVLSSPFGGDEPVDALAKAAQAAGRALELDATIAEAHFVLGEVALRRWQWTEAEARYRRVLDLDPNNAAAHAGRARWLLAQRRTDEALEWAQRARELDPLALYGRDIGWILFLSRRYADAIRELNTVLAVQPDESGALWYLGFAMIEHGEAAEAVRVLERSAALSGRNPAVLGVLVRAYARGGRSTEALRVLGELTRRREAGYVPAAAFVNAYLGLGDYERALEWLDRAFDERSKILLHLKVHLFFDPLRNDPRYEALQRRMNFPK
jgi:TolB-like protein/tetratricopeptide (TPR) repeat protein